MTWMHRLRLRVLALALGLALAAIALTSLTTIPLWPVVGVAFAAVAVAVNSMGSKLSSHVCHGCGTDIGDQPAGQYGVACPKCGRLTQRLAFRTGTSAPASSNDAEGTVS